MRVAILSLTYYPDHTGSAVYATDLARFLGERGHDVTVITTFPHYPSWKKQPGDKGTLFRTEKHGRVRVLRGYTYVPASVTSWKRVAYELSFLAFAAANALRAGPQDLVITVSLRSWWVPWDACSRCAPAAGSSAMSRIFNSMQLCRFVCCAQV